MNWAGTPLRVAALVTVLIISFTAGQFIKGKKVTAQVCKTFKLESCDDDGSGTTVCDCGAGWLNVSQANGEDERRVAFCMTQ